MATRNLVVTQEERQLLGRLLGRAWNEANDRRLLCRANSPQEAAALADQQLLEGLQAKLTQRETA